MKPFSDAPTTANRQKIFIVDDHPIVRKGLTQLLAAEPDFEVCGEADNVDTAFELVAKCRPDLMVIDVSLKDSFGVELVTRIKECYPDVKMLVWSMFDEKVFAERVLRAGATGYIDKQQSVENVIDAIRQVLRGEIYLSSRMTKLLLRRVGSGQPLTGDPIARLTDRELEVFRLIGKGVTTRKIARELGLSPKTVESHREKIKSKLQIKNGAELSERAVRWVLENG